MQNLMIKPPPQKKKKKKYTDFCENSFVDYD